jgi:hypothetical protein
MGGAIECPLCGNNQAYCKCTRLEKEQFLEIARLREERRWISVGERLPEDEEWVDVSGKWGDFIGWHDGEQWTNCDEDQLPNVTHWRKRTPGPEGNGNG